MARMTLDELVGQLRAAYGDTLRAVVLYGSAAAGEHIAKRSDYNVLVIVDALGASQLAAASAAARAWADAGNPAPLTLTQQEWRGSADIFPMEYADILERHRVLYGDPPFNGITVDRGDLRLQLEQEAMGKLIKLRQGALAAGNEGDRQLDLLAASVSPVMIVFRAFLRLHGVKPPTDNVALTEQVASRAGFDGEPIVRVVRHVRGEAKLKPEDGNSVIAGYLQALERLVSYLDTFHAPI
jgi:hypothetical protein